jgi:dolichol-phosphate mannosyltransferase
MKKELSIILPVFNEKESLPIMVRLLNSSIKFKKEIIIIYDFENDNTIQVAKELAEELEDVKVVHNNISPGVKFAVEKGVQNSKYENILITAVDEIFPIISVEKMLDLLIDNDLEFVSGTRYSKGGIRLGGSLIGAFFSRTANKIFNFLTNIPLSDCTTGIKLMKKKIWNSIQLDSKPVGWAFAFELSIKVYLAGYKIDELPLKSVDRLFGGSSTFKLGPWLKEYLKWFFWGIKKIYNEKKK